MDKVQEVNLHLQMKHNFEWRWYCTENDLTRQDLYQIFGKTERMIIISGLIMVLTFFQILIC
jgi:phage protein U